jgi:hypothetical protein
VSDEKEKLDLSIAQLATGALSTITVTLVSARFLGSAGTMTAAGVSSVLSTSASAIYKHGWNRTTQRLQPYVKRKRKVPEGAHPEVHGMKGYVVQQTGYAYKPNWKMFGAIAAAAAGTFAGVTALTTGAEAVAGKPVSAIVQNKPGTGTSLFGGHVSPHPTLTPSPRPTGSTSSNVSTPAPVPSQRTTQPSVSVPPTTSIPAPSIPAPVQTTQPQQPEDPQPTG